eukprot:scaffold124720_cov69-Phaeocystis_antarctica.AAC.2
MMSCWRMKRARAWKSSCACSAVKSPGAMCAPSAAPTSLPCATARVGKLDPAWGGETRGHEMREVREFAPFSRITRAWHACANEDYDRHAPGTRTDAHRITRARTQKKVTAVEESVACSKPARAALLVIR